MKLNQDNQHPPGALQNVRVIDLSRVLAGPLCSMILADHGADVIKVEPPQGDDTRRWGPPFARGAQGEAGDASYYIGLNRNKQAMVLDLARPEGREVLYKLLEGADVLIENYKHGDLDRYGLGYKDLSVLNPRLIYCSVTGFGQTGPYAERPGYDFMIQGMGGMMSVTGAPGGGPQRAGVPVADIITGMYASIAICAAIAGRAESGLGQHLDLALLDSQIALLAYQNTNYFATGTPPKRIGNLHPNIVPYQPFRTSDGDVIVACGNDNLYRKLCDMLGRPDLATDARFVTNGKRVENRVAMTRVLQEIFSTRSTKEWVEALEAAGVANGPINNLAQVFEEPQVKARGVRIELEHPVAGRIPLVASPMRFSGTPVEYRNAPPVLGQHTDEILGTVLGRSAAEIAKLKADGIV